MPSYSCRPNGIPDRIIIWPGRRGCAVPYPKGLIHQKCLANAQADKTNVQFYRQFMVMHCRICRYSDWNRILCEMKKRKKKYYPNIQKTSRGQKGRPVRKKNRYSAVNIGKTIILAILGIVIVLGIFARARHFILYHVQDRPHEQANGKLTNEGAGRLPASPK
ncbi:hypothetical protein [Flavobacterium defluvii]|uniref:Uncharacterized protein n=2 Tax=Flavobacteriaceae TaxID=49546 RepID=A0A1M5JB22_9FLAO|nr:hypothetical protein [Flavobacterium defluvii]SHG37450.1 hypothetical protein SAMN05443663_102655 [Flavobacterium defluvii]